MGSRNQNLSGGGQMSEGAPKCGMSPKSLDIQKVKSTTNQVKHQDVSPTTSNSVNTPHFTKASRSDAKWVENQKGHVSKLGAGSSPVKDAGGQFENIRNVDAPQQKVGDSKSHLPQEINRDEELITKHKVSGVPDTKMNEKPRLGNLVTGVHSFTTLVGARPSPGVSSIHAVKSKPHNIKQLEKPKAQGDRNKDKYKDQPQVRNAGTVAHSKTEKYPIENKAQSTFSKQGTGVSGSSIGGQQKIAKDSASTNAVSRSNGNAPPQIETSSRNGTASVKENSQQSQRSPKSPTPKPTTSGKGKSQNRPNSKRIPSWAKHEELMIALQHQLGPDANAISSKVFPDFNSQCNLEAIFRASGPAKVKGS